MNSHPEKSRFGVICFQGKQYMETNDETELLSASKISHNEELT